jgi:hypothetical protein
MNTRAVPPDGRAVDRGLSAFYVVVAVIALAGQTGAAIEWLHWPLLLAIGAVAAVEFGGIVLSVYADHRRRLGERALAARLLSAAVAAGAVAVNWLGHHDRLQAAFFAGMSALGYLVWLLHSGARRRDQLRATGNLPPVAPVYGPWQWLRHPGLTRRARALALADPSLGLYGSHAAARAAVRTERRQTAIAALLRRKLTAGRDGLAAEIAVTVYDVAEIAARLAAGADYAGLAALLAVDLQPARVAASPAVPAGEPEPAEPTGSARASGQRRERAAAPSRPRLDGAAGKVARARARHPEATQREVANRTGLSVRTVARHWADTAPAGAQTAHPGNGGPVPAEAVTGSTDLPAATVAGPSN